MRVALLLVSLALCCVGARAEDFSGFYAGVNAGYGFGHDRDKRTGPGMLLLDSGEAETPDRSLPPSAASASQTMEDARFRAGRRSR